MEKIYTSCDYDEYYEDFHVSMRSSELTQFKYSKRSPQLDSRIKLIQFCRKLCVDRLMARTTLHMACYILDRFMDVFEIAPERLKMFGAVCVLLAAKVEDRGDLIPRWADLQSLFEAKVEPREYAIFECMILNSLRWKINVPTAASFIEYYIVASITIQDVPIRLRGRPAEDQKAQVYPALRLRMYNLIYYLLDLSLEDVDMIGVRPSKLASASILCARQILGYRPFWTEELRYITKYNMQDIFGIAKMLRKQYVAVHDLDLAKGSVERQGKRVCPFDDVVKGAKRIRE